MKFNAYELFTDNKIINVIRKEDMCDKGYCQNCILSWEQWSAYHEDCDCGCMMQDTSYNDMCGGWFCIMPKWIKEILKERYKKRKEKEIDDFCTFIESQMKDDEQL